MCFTKMIKKMVTAVCLLAVVGMFASCSSPSSSSSSDSDPVKEDYVYEFIYKGKTVATGMTGKQVLAIIEEYGLKEGKDYKVDNDKKTVTFTDSGYEKATKADQGGSNGKDDNAVEDCFVKCDDIIINKMPQEYFDNIGKMFDIPADGTLSADKKTFTLTDAGLDKYIELYAGDGKDKVVNPVAIVVYEGYTVMALDQTAYNKMGKLLTENTDYKAYKNGKIIVITDSGWDKASKEM